MFVVGGGGLIASLTFIPRLTNPVDVTHACDQVYQLPFGR